MIAEKGIWEEEVDDKHMLSYFKCSVCGESHTLPFGKSPPPNCKCDKIIEKQIEEIYEKEMRHYNSLTVFGKLFIYKRPKRIEIKKHTIGNL